MFADGTETIELLYQRVIQAVAIKSVAWQEGSGRNAAFILVRVWLYQNCWFENDRTGKAASIIKEEVDVGRWRSPKSIMHWLYLTKLQGWLK